MSDDSLKLRIVNLGLGRLGVPALGALTEEGTEATQARAVIDQVLRGTLRRHPWPFATKYADPMTLVDGEDGDPVNRDWTFAYAYPADCIFVRRILEDTGREFLESPSPYRLGREGDQAVIYTNIEDAGIEYTAIFDCPVELADELFIDAAAWLMASELALSCARNKMTARECLAFFVGALTTAATIGEREQQKSPPGEAEWIRNR